MTNRGFSLIPTNEQRNGRRMPPTWVKKQLAGKKALKLIARVLFTLYESLFSLAIAL